MTRRVLGGLLAALAVLVPVVPAGAAPDVAGLALSQDGRTWTEDLTTPLFSPDVRWVPGDVRRVSVYVANHGPTAAEVTVRLRTRADRLVDPGDVRLEARLLGERWRPLDGPGASAELTEVVALPTGAPRRIDLRAAFRPDARNRSQSSAVRLAFEIQLSQAPDGDLPSTGAPTLWVPGALGVVLVALGALALRQASRRIEPRDG